MQEVLLNYFTSYLPSGAINLQQRKYSHYTYYTCSDLEFKFTNNWL